MWGWVPLNILSTTHRGWFIIKIVYWHNQRKRKKINNNNNFDFFVCNAWKWRRPTNRLINLLNDGRLMGLKLLIDAQPKFGLTKKYSEGSDPHDWEEVEATAAQWVQLLHQFRRSSVHDRHVVFEDTEMERRRENLPPFLPNVLVAEGNAKKSLDRVFHFRTHDCFCCSCSGGLSYDYDEWLKAYRESTQDTKHILRRACTDKLCVFSVRCRKYRNTEVQFRAGTLDHWQFFGYL